MKNPTRDVVFLWIGIMGSGASALWAIYLDLLESMRAGQWGRLSLWAFAYACLIFVTTRIYRTGAKRIAELEERLKPKLAIGGVVQDALGNIQRVKVHNDSAMTVRFSAVLLSIEPRPPNCHKIKPLLPIETSDLRDHKEANIPGGGDAMLNVLVWSGDDVQKKERLYGLLIAGPPVIGSPECISIPMDHCRIRIQAFPVSPPGPPSAPRDFYITPQTDKTLLLIADAGLTPQPTS